MARPTQRRTATCALCLVIVSLAACGRTADSTGDREPVQVKPAAPAPAPELTPLLPPKAAEETAARCEEPSPRLAGSETYVYAGIQAYSAPERRGPDGTVTPVKRATRDGTYNALTLRPDGAASGWFFSVRAGGAPQFSATDEACWRWLVEERVDPPRRLEVTIGGGRLQFLRSSTELRERQKHDKLGTERVYERVATPREPTACPQVADELQLFEGHPEGARAAYTVPTERGMRALLLGRDGSAALLEAAVDGTKLAWSSEPGCWTATATRKELSVARSGNGQLQRFARDGEGLRLLGGVSPAHVYLPAR